MNTQVLAFAEGFSLKGGEHTELVLVSGTYLSPSSSPSQLWGGAVMYLNEHELHAA